jgi:Concanavalin A-like lectin/glucanases superfamily
MTMFAVTAKKSRQIRTRVFPTALLKLLTPLVFLLILFSSAEAAGSPGLVGYWSFDDGTATDNSGNGNNGTLINNPAVVAGKTGQALSFDGGSQYINVGNVLNPGTGDLSVFAWVKTTQAGGLNMIVSKRNSSVGTNPGYQLFQNGSGALSFTFGDGNSSRVRVDSTGPRINDGNWHLVGVVYTRAANGVIYVDGVPATGGSGSITSQSGSVSNSLPLRFGLEDQTGQSSIGRVT